MLLTLGADVIDVDRIVWRTEEVIPFWKIEGMSEKFFATDRTGRFAIDIPRPIVVIEIGEIINRTVCLKNNQL